MLVFSGSMSFVDLPVNSGFANNPMTHLPKTHYSTIPAFQLRSEAELSSIMPDFIRWLKHTEIPPHKNSLFRGVSIGELKWRVKETGVPTIPLRNKILVFH